MSTRLVAKQAEAMGLVEAAHDGDGDWQAWCEVLFGAASRLLTSPLINVGVGRRGAARYEILGAVGPQRQALDYIVGMAGKEGASLFDPFWRFPGYVGKTSDIHAVHPSTSVLAQFRELVGSADILGLVAIANDVSIAFGSHYPEPIHFAQHDRILLTQIALHLEAGLRLRAEPGAAVAWLDTSGRVVHAEGEAREAAKRDEFSAHVKVVERSRTRRHRQSMEAVAAWQALISGRWALVERGQNDLTRRYAIVPTEGASRLRAWSELETRAVELSARGLVGKMVAYALGVDGGTVSKLLASAALKVGVCNRTELVRLTANLLGTGPRSDVAALTAAERDVLALVRMGWTNADIARTRSRSENTIAKQVASLLQKLRVPSRRALAASTSGRA